VIGRADARDSSTAKIARQGSTGRWYRNTTKYKHIE